MKTLFWLAFAQSVFGFVGSVSPGPYVTDLKGTPLLPIERSLCGADDMVLMTKSSQLLQQLGTPVGILSINMNNSVGKCSGALISKNLFLTAKHCEAGCQQLDVTFGFLSRSENFKCKKILERGDDAYENDYMILELEGSPGVQWGWFEVSGRKLAKDHELLIIHHPMGSPMKVSKECPVWEQSANYVHHRCDTMPGSSGSAILDPDYKQPEKSRIVGVHTLGGCGSSSTSHNSGPSMQHLMTLSPILRSMAKD